MIVVVINKSLLERDYRVALARKMPVTIAMPPSKIALSGVRLYPLRIYGGFNLYRELIGLWDLATLIKSKKDALFHFYSSKYYTLGPVLCHLLGVENKPTITINGLGRLAKKNKGLKFRVLCFFLKLGLRYSQGVIFQNKADRDFFIERFGHLMKDLNSEVIYSGLEREVLEGLGSQEKGQRGDKPTVLFVGRQNRDKGVDYFYELARRLDKSFHFKMIGERPEDSNLTAKMLSLQQSGVLSWQSYTPNVIKEIADAFCLIVPSDREGLPRVLMEAYSVGIPVVGFDVPGVGEFIVPSVTGELAGEHNLESLEEALLKVHKNGQEFYRKGAVQFFEKNFSIEQFILKSTEFYKRLDIKGADLCE